MIHGNRNRRLFIEQCEPRLLLAGLTSSTSFDPEGDNLSDIALGMLNYESATGRFSKHAIYDGDSDQPLLSWRVAILPYLGHSELYDQFNLREPWDSPHNLRLLGRMPEVYRGPGDSVPSPLNRPTTKTVYQVMLGDDTIFPEGNEAVRINQISDGRSNTVLAVETNSDRAVFWTKPEDVVFNLSNPLAGLGNITDDGFRAILADTESFEADATIDPQLWSNLVVRNDGQFADLNQVLPPFDPDTALSKIGRGLFNFELVNQSLPAPAINSGGEQPLLSWRVNILPMIGHQNLYDQFRLDEPWDSPHNLSLVSSMPREFRHPNVAIGMTSFQVVVSEGTAFPEDVGEFGVRLHHIRDGVANTLAVVEANADRSVEWTRPLDLAFDPENPLDGLGAANDLGFHAISVAGEVFDVPASVDPVNWTNFVLRDDGNFVDLSQMSDPFESELALKKIALAALNYEAANSQYPAYAIVDDINGAPLLSWRVAILPFIGQRALYEQFRLDEPWDSLHNVALLPNIPREFRNEDIATGMTNRLAFVGEGTIFPRSTEGIRPSDVLDGTSNTILFVEANLDAAVLWTRPADIDFDPNEPLADVGEISNESFNAAFADGSVEEISNSIAADDFRRLVIRNDTQSTVIVPGAANIPIVAPSLDASSARKHSRFNRNVIVDLVFAVPKVGVPSEFTPDGRSS